MKRKACETHLGADYTAAEVEFLRRVDRPGKVGSGSSINPAPSRPTKW